MTFGDQIRSCWAQLISRYGLRVIPGGEGMTYVVVSKQSIFIVLDHPSHGGVDLRLNVRSRKGWSSYSANSFLWTRSSAKPEIKDDEGIRAELELMAWKLDEAGGDMLRGENSWTREYEERLGTPVSVLKETEVLLDSLVNIAELPCACGKHG
jgi:hypothetical protein